MKAIKKVNLLVVILILVVAIQTQAQWATDAAVNNPVSTAIGNQFNQKVVSDMADGAIIVWQDTRSGNANIYAQRINGLGLPLWTANGVPICTAVDAQTNPKIISDGSGGAFITWQDKRNGSNFDIYAQRINASGVVQWTINGVAISTAVNDQSTPNIESDLEGGAIIVWTDARGADFDIYGQRVNGSGAVQWTANGKAICSVSANQMEPVIKAKGISLPFIVAWNDTRNAGTSGFDIYYQSVSVNGNLYEVAEGVALCTANQNQVITDIHNGPSLDVIITWIDGRNFSDDIYAQRIRNGAEWAVNGVVVCNASNTQTGAKIEVSGNDIYIAWEDWRNSNADIYAQKLNASGVAQWTANGVGVNVNSGGQFYPSITAAAGGGIFVTWADLTISGIYGQKLNGNGVLQWTTTGVPIGTALSDQEYPVAISEFTSSGHIVTWTDNRNGNQDIYAQRVNSDGLLCGNVPDPGFISGTSPVGAGSNRTYSINPVLGATSFQWTLPAGWTGSSTTNVIQVIVGGSSGDVTVRASNACGLSEGISTRNITVNKINQGLEFGSLPTKIFGDADFTLTATAGSGLPVTFTSSNINVATISGSTVTIVGVGTTTITASQPGNDIWNPALSVLRDLVVNKGDQTITFAALPSKTVGDAPFALTATSSSGLPVEYTSSNTSIATVSGNTVTLLAAGNVTIHANQPGNANFNAATQVSQSFCVNPAKPTITATGVNTESPTLTSNATSGNQWFLNDAPITGATNATLAVAAAGIYKVQVTTGGCASAFSANFTFVITGDDSFRSSQSQFSIYPNPTFDRLTVSLPNDYQNKEVSIYTINGQRVDFNQTYDREVQFDVAGYAPGIYLIKMSSARANGIIRFTKQ